MVSQPFPGVDAGARPNRYPGSKWLKLIILPLYTGMSRP